MGFLECRAFAVKDVALIGERKGLRSVRRLRYFVGNHDFGLRVWGRGPERFSICFLALLGSFSRAQQTQQNAKPNYKRCSSTMGHAVYVAQDVAFCEPATGQPCPTTKRGPPSLLRNSA